MSAKRTSAAGTGRGADPEAVGPGSPVGWSARPPESRPRLEAVHVGFVQDHVEGIEIAGQTAHLDMFPLSDDDRVVAVPSQIRTR